MDVAGIRALFPDLEGTIYLDSATQGVGPRAAREAIATALDEWTRGCFDWTAAERAGEEARAMLARIIGASTEEIAMVNASSTAAGIVAANLPPARGGESVVVAENEFTSNLFPWLLLRERGYEVRTVAAAANFAPEAFAQRCDGGTRLLAVSAIHSPTGYRTDLRALSEVAHRSGGLFFVDACQAAGAVPVDVTRDGIDLLATASYKFLLGARGIGYLYVRRQLLDSMRPVLAGWKSTRRPLESFYGPDMDLSPAASRLDTSLSWFAALAERASLGIFLQLGIDAIHRRNAQLSRRLHDRLHGHPGFHPFPEPHRSCIASLAVDDTEAVVARLRAAGIVAAVRAGRVRLSVHFYNREEDIDRAVHVLGAA